ncbi:NYN domain-containing protein [Patescibacteria group bacterium]|nr:NYN domain-containing protein [Patescibacteria group bacterium]
MHYILEATKKNEQKENNNIGMDLEKLKQQYIKDDLKITKEYGRVFSFIDFGNVNKWFDKDAQDWDNKLLPKNQRLTIDIKKLKNFADIFSDRVRCYYGRNPKNKGSALFCYALEKVFDKIDFVWKDLQKIKHYLELEEKETTKLFKTDDDGKDYIEIRKCNFDVEISVDAIKMLKHYDTFFLFSGDADFVYLNNFLRKKGKKIILIKAGYITTKLRKSADLIINAQRVKKHIAKIKQRPDKSGLCG